MSGDIRAFDVVEVISVVETGHVISHGRWVAEMDTSNAVFRRAHELARNVGGVVVASSPTVLGDYR